jgi:hypothetical protein
LFLLGAFVGKPFGVETPPWKSFDVTFAAIESLPQHQPVGATAEQKASTQRLVNILKPYNQPKYRLLYTACFFLFVAGLNCITDFLCLGITRKILREMLSATSFTSLLALHTLNFFSSACVYTSCLSFVCVAAVPSFWGIVAVLILLFVVNKFVGICLIASAIFAALWFGPPWITTFAVNAALPSAALLVLSIFALVMYPFRVRIHAAVGWILDKAALREKLVIAIGVAFLTLIIAGLSKVL